MLKSWECIKLDRCKDWNDYVDVQVVELTKLITMRMVGYKFLGRRWFQSDRVKIKGIHQRAIAIVVGRLSEAGWASLIEGDMLTWFLDIN